MQTDIPLKRLTLLCAADLLPLFGLPHTELVTVETLELPSSAARLDNVLRVRSAQGQEYLHIVEWQGYRDTAMLWRMAGYMAWLGQRAPATSITGTIVYLTAESDTGDRLTQIIDGRTIHDWFIPCVRLWEQDAKTALASGATGLAVLSPLMRAATPELVEQALDLVLHQAPPEQQADLLSMLGIFAEPLVAPDRLVQLVGRERLMTSSFASYLLADKTAEIEARARTEALQQTLEEAMIARFPNAPLILLRDVRRVTDADRLRGLIVAIIQVADLAEFEQQLKQTATA
jgi:predicted transposase YdaD